MKKKVLSAVLAFTMILTSLQFPACVMAEETVDYIETEEAAAEAFAETDGEALGISVSEDEISGTSEDENTFSQMYTAKEVKGYWHFADGVLSYTASETGSVNFDEINTDDVKKVVIASGPTSSDKYKCNGFANLEEVVYEPPITIRDMCAIEKEMFRDCPKLKKVTVGKSRAGAGLEFNKRAFYNCPLLTEVSLGNGIWHFGRQTFGDCVGLTSFKFPDDMHDIRGDSFWGCTNLTNISLASSNPFMKVDHNAVYEYFDPYNNKDWGGVTRPGAYITPCLVFVPEGIVKQNDGKYTVTKGIKDIQFWTFMGNKSLTNLTLASTVESIQLEAFLHCDNLSSVTMPRALKRVGQNAFSPYEPHDFKGYDEESGDPIANVNEKLKDIYYQGSEEEWKQIELATYTLDEGHINKMTIAGRGTNGKILPDYQKEYLYNNLEKAGIPADVSIHYNSELADTSYTLGKSKPENTVTPDVIYQESKIGAADDSCSLEANGKVWELKGVSDSGTHKITLAKGNKFKIPNFDTLVEGDETKCVAVNKKGVLNAKKDTSGSTVSVTYNTTEGKKVTLKVSVIKPQLVDYESVSANSVSSNAVSAVKNITVTASLEKGNYVDCLLCIPDNYAVNMSRTVNKCEAEWTLRKESDGRIHLKARILRKGTVKIPVSVNGKLFNVKLVVKK